MKHSEKEKKDIIKEFQNSRFTKEEYCKQKQIAISTLNRWLRYEKNRVCKSRSK